MTCINELDRVALDSVLHPVRHATDGVVDQIWICNSDTGSPSADEALRALDVLAAEVARARTLVQRLGENPDA
ncbi:hypothetical protein ACFWY5_31935 [Nonomuraea sp. NPDC059007]|uniref:hypothetical protein n=1 Tax=Nonomuraea sp. NPDC059007 TaxID=3346692 RepID=UPI003693E619